MSRPPRTPLATRAIASTRAVARRRHGRRLLPVLAMPWLAWACDARVTAPVATTAASLARGSADASLAVTSWNARARALVSSHATTPPIASRAYALLSVAQHEALRALAERDPGGARGPAWPDARIVASHASARVLGALFPVARASLEQDAAAEVDGARRPPGHAAAADDLIALAREKADAVLAHAASDGAGAVWSGTVPTGPGLWFSSLDPPRAPLLPLWGAVRPWLLRSGDELRPEPPPAFGSPGFLAALAEVRHYADTRTPEEQRIAEYWADGPGTATPPGHWNAIASAFIERHRLDELSAARVLAYMNMAVMDAGIACWDAKFAYWLIRPSQADPAISLAVELPNFPAYTSGHSSFSGAASVVLGWYFPGDRSAIEAMAEEAAISRVYGGIHYRFDSDVGLRQGRAVGELAIRAAARRGHALPRG